MSGSRERPIVLSGSAHPKLAAALASELGLSLGNAEVGAFPDGEVRVEIREHVGGRHVVLVQPTCAPAERNIFELCLMSDACRRAGADRVTAVIPYFGYARHDRRRHEGDAIAVRVVTDLLAAAHVDRIVGVDVHCAAIEALSSIPFVHLSAQAELVNAVDVRDARRIVVVAPDLGAAKLAQRIGRSLGTPVAFVHKLRRSGTEVEVSGVTGDVRDREPLIVDDMISTGGTIEAAAEILLSRGCRPSISILATHGLFVGDALARLGHLPIRRAIVSDSVPEVAAPAFPIERASIAKLLARAIEAIHQRQSLEASISHA